MGFPLHNPERLQQWLSQMNQEKWVPTRYQHLCSEHFAPSCFEYRWGVRYLKPDAIPTIFQLSEKPLKRENPARPPCETQAKKLIGENSMDRTSQGPQAVATHPTPDTLEALAIAIDPALSSAPIYVEAQPSVSDLDLHALSSPLVGAVNLMPLVQIVEPLNAVALAVASPTEGVESIPIHLPGQPFPPAVDQRVDFSVEASPDSFVADVPEQFATEIMVSCEDAAVVDQ
uniref:THAP domain containing 8 n=1 Tax=Chrysemys picta bellii TaxID=8478 RepID=A0A8C3H8X7_CHRPI